MKTFIIPSFIITALITCLAYAPVSIADADNMHGKQFSRLVKKLDLTPEQQEKAKQIKEQHMQDIKAIKQSNKKSTFKADYEALISAESFNESKAEALAQARSDKMKSLFVLKAKVSHDLYQILDDSQKEKYLTMLKKHKGKHKKRD